MHAQGIIQELLDKSCVAMHAKRRTCLAKIAGAAQRSCLSLLGISKTLSSVCALRHRIKCCDRLLGNPHLDEERLQVYQAMARRVLPINARVAILIDWSDLCPDSSCQLLRAAVAARGRAFVIYEEVHPRSLYGSHTVHRKFLHNLRTVLPQRCQPVIVTDAGFRAAWFKLLDELGFEWVGRIRNRDKVQAHGSTEWVGCKTYYADTRGRARDLGQFKYVRSNPITCRLVLYKGKHQGREAKTVFGTRSHSQRSKKNREAQHEPWLLAVAPGLGQLNATAVARLYRCRMQIEQTFRDVKNDKLGLGLSSSQSRQPRRLAALLLIGALVIYALWLIGLAARESGFVIAYGSHKKSQNTLSTLSLARQWLLENGHLPISRSLLQHALHTLAVIIKQAEI